MRGIFAAGVLDVFHEYDFHPFAFAIGASAGACNLSSHLAGQHRRNVRCFTEPMLRPQFVDLRRWLRGGHWMDLDWLWEVFAQEIPLDAEAAVAHRTRLVVAATDVETGEPRYFEPMAAELDEVLRASSAVPIMYRKVVTLADGRRYADGGVSAPIPVAEAYRRGARKIVVIRSRPLDHPGPSRVESLLARVALRGQPGMQAAFARYRAVYAAARAWMASPPADCRVVQIAPDALRTGRTTRDRDALAVDYARGRAAGLAAMLAWE